MGSPALVCKRSGRLLRGHAMRFVVMVRLSLRLLGFFLKFAGIPTTSPSWFDIYTVMHTFLMSTVVFSNGLHLPTKAETDIMDHIIRSFFKDKLTATYCKHNDANYPMMEYVFKSISWSSFLLESTNCGFPPPKKNINSVLHQQKTQAETKKTTETKKCHHHIIHPHLAASKSTSSTNCSAIGSTSSALAFRCPLSAISVQVSGHQLWKVGFLDRSRFFLRMEWHGTLWVGLRVWAWFIFGFIMV